MTIVSPAASAGATFQRHLQERVVPRPDQPAHPDRLVDDPRDGVLAGCRVDEPAGLLVGEARVVAEDLDDVVDVPAALAERLAGVQRLGPGDLVAIALEEVGGPVERVRRARRPGVRASRSRRTRGARRRSLAGRRRRRRRRPRVTTVASRRVDDVARGARRGRRPLAVDEEARHGSLAAVRSGRQDGRRRDGRVNGRSHVPERRPRGRCHGRRTNRRERGRLSPARAILLRRSPPTVRRPGQEGSRA